MRRETKKQVFAVFILLAFLGSTIAYAVSLIVPQQKKQELIFEKPLLEEEEAKYLSSNFVVLRFYYTSGCCEEEIKSLEQVLSDLGKMAIIEKIDVNKYPEQMAVIGNKTGYNVADGLPALLIRGRSETIMQGVMNENDIFNKACDLYFEPIEVCPI